MCIRDSLALDHDYHPLIVHGDGDNGQWGQNDVQIYITGWDSDGDGIPNWKDVCPRIYGLSTDDKIGCQDLNDDGFIDSLSNFVGENQVTVGVAGIVVLVTVGVALFRRREFSEDMFAVDIQESDESFDPDDGIGLNSQ